MMERKIMVVSNELSNRKLILEEKLEKLINSEAHVGKTRDKIIKTLSQIAQINQTMEIWNELIVEITKINKEDNGSI